MPSPCVAVVTVGETQAGPGESVASRPTAHPSAVPLPAAAVTSYDREGELFYVVYLVRIRSCFKLFTHTP